MAPGVRVVRKVAELRGVIARYRAAGDAVALVPTMGALHEGHLSLVRFARRKAKRVVVSIFVNPAQFGPGEDFGTYPRTWKTDLVALKQVKADLIWAPAVDEMYAKEFATRISPEGPAAVGLEDGFRPHFLGGVATVVAKLLLQCLPDIAVFGEKDYQQLKVVTRMAADLNIPVRIVGAPTVREADGLAMSSRNAYLTPAERAVASTLYQVLRRSAQRIAQGQSISRALADGRKAIIGAGFALDYLEARHADTLRPLQSKEEPIRLLVAAKLGKTRLIDNVSVP